LGIKKTGRKGGFLAHQLGGKGKKGCRWEKLKKLVTISCNSAGDHKKEKSIENGGPSE